MNNQTNAKSRNIRSISLLLSIAYLLLIIIFSYTNDLISSIFNNTVSSELSFILFITYLLIYIKDAVVNDYIELAIEKQDKAFIPHLLEHTLEPLIIFIFFLGTTRLLLLGPSQSILMKIFVIIITPTLYFGIKKTIESYVKKTGT